VRHQRAGSNDLMPLGGKKLEKGSTDVSGFHGRRQSGRKGSA
jgi:hypothetical protein